MVQINNSYKGMNSPIIDNYFRNLDEYRKSAELSFLPVLEYFIAKSEKSGKIIIPSHIIEDQKEYIKSLGKKYLKRDFDFIADPSDSEEAYDVLTKLIRKTKKCVQYAHCDCLDFILEKPELFEHTIFPSNLLNALFEETREFNHVVPSLLESYFSMRSAEQKSKQQTLQEEPPRNTGLSAIGKFENASELYEFVLENVKRAIDFELLKMYDFLIESKNAEFKSNKLLEIKEYLVNVCEGEYCKQTTDVKISPFTEKTTRSKNEEFVDEWASNIRRAIETKMSITQDYLDFAKKTEWKSSNPEIKMLLHHFRENI